MMFIDEWRPKFKGDKATEEHPDNIEKEYGSKCGAAFERLIRAASEAGIWLDAPAMKALEEKRGWDLRVPYPPPFLFSTDSGYRRSTVAQICRSVPSAIARRPIQPTTLKRSSSFLTWRSIVDVVHVTALPLVAMRKGIPNKKRSTTPARFRSRPKMFSALVISSCRCPPRLRPLARSGKKMDWTVDHAPAGIALMAGEAGLGLLDAWASSPR